MEYARKNLAVRHAMSKDVTRHNLNGVHFDKRGYVVATDGHVMLVTNGCDKRETDGWLGAAEVETTVKVARAKKAETVEPELIESGEGCDVNFPDWHFVLQRNKEPHATVTLDVRLLERIVKAAKEYSGTGSRDSIPLTLYIGEELDAVRFEGGKSLEGFEGSVMPMRIK